jgi:tetratricopeptide (TPR) repeat protein
MKRNKVLIGTLLAGVWLVAGGFAATQAQTIGKYVPIPAGSDADKALTEVNAATDPTQKLALIDKFAATAGQSDMATVADDLYVNYYIAAKNYDKAFEYGDKLFELDADNFNNAVNMVRAAAEKGDTEKAFAYGDKLSAIVKRFQDKPTPEGNNEASWADQKKRVLESAHDNLTYAQ